jgi:CRP-like cAMP-binding protein
MGCDELMLASKRMASAPVEVWGDLATTAFVEASHLFKSLEPEARSDLLQLARLVAFAPGEVVSSESDDAFYLVLDGAAAAQVAAPGGPVEIAHLERGAFFGEARVLGAGRPATLVAVSDVKVVAFPAPVIAAMSGRFPKVRKLLEAVLSAREKAAALKVPP